MESPTKKVQELLEKNALDALLVSSLSNIIYLTGFTTFTAEEREAFLLITKTNQYLFTNALYIEAAQRDVKDFTVIETTSRNPLFSSLKKLLEKHAIKKMGFEASDLKTDEYFGLKKTLGPKMLTASPSLVEKVRLRKTPSEITALEKACALGDKAFQHIVKQITLGMTEIELATEIEYFFKKNNATISFRPIVAFGAHASSPHHLSTTKALEKDTLVLVDFGAKVAMYCSDMTRTFFFGKATDEQKKMYHAVLQAQEASFAFLNANTNCNAGDVDSVAREHIIKAGYPSIPHSLGHGIGIDVHEDPKLTPGSKDTLENGMIFSIEPGIYIPGFGGVRIEDLVVIENNIPRYITHAPKSLLEV